MAEKIAAVALPTPAGTVTIRLSGAGADAAALRLEQLLARMRDQTPAWRAIGAQLRQRTVANWGRGWPARRRDPGWPILFHTGELYAAVTGAAAVQIGPRGVRYGSAKPKFLWHQYGTSRGIPPRPMIRRDAGDARMAAGLLRAYVLGGGVGTPTTGSGPWTVVA